jgi:hypothetical protein
MSKFCLFIAFSVCRSNIAVAVHDAKPPVKLTSFEMGCYYAKDPSALEQGGEKGRSYRGLVSYTISGRTCKNWLSDNPFKGAGQKPTPDIEEGGIMKWGNGLGNHNYCRNPDSAEGFNEPWCFTTDPKVPKEACNIQQCKAGDHSPQHYWDEAQDLAETMKDGMSLDEPTPCTCKRHSGAFGKDVSKDFYGAEKDFAINTRCKRNSEGSCKGECTWTGTACEAADQFIQLNRRKAGFLQNFHVGTTKDGKPCSCP